MFNIAIYAYDKINIELKNLHRHNNNKLTMKKKKKRIKNCFLCVPVARRLSDCFFHCQSF